MSPGTDTVDQGSDHLLSGIAEAENAIWCQGHAADIPLCQQRFGPRVLMASSAAVAEDTTTVMCRSMTGPCDMAIEGTEAPVWQVSE